MKKARSLPMCAALGLLWCVVGAWAQSTTQSPAVKDSPLADKRLMSDADFKTFLLQVEAVLPTLETQLKNIDLEKAPGLSYSQGKSIADQRDIGLMEIGNIRVHLAKLQAKRTVSGELGLYVTLESLSNDCDGIVWAEVVGGLTLTSLEKYAPKMMGPLIGRIGNDVLARVALLEKGSCPDPLEGLHK